MTTTTRLYMAAPLVDCLGRETVKCGKNRKSQLLRTWSSSITASVAFSALLWETHLSWVDTILVGLSVRSAALLWLGLVQDSRRAGHVFSTWTLNGLIRAKELTHNNCQHPKVGAFPSSCLRTAWSPTPWDFQAFLQFCRLLYNSSNSSLFQLTRFSFYCSQSRNQKDTKPLFHGPLSHPVFQLFQSHEMIWDNDKCVPGV